MRRKICVISGSRAEYGLLKPLLEAIRADRGLRLQLLVTGMHLARGFGLTYREIELDGFKINEKVRMALDSDTNLDTVRAIGLSMAKFAEAYRRLKPDIVVGMGDRFELFSAITAAFVSGIAIAHISGGEVTEGVLDDSFRHAITKMSHLHFTSTEAARKRVIQLGESPQRVFKVGEVGLDDINKMKFLTKEQLEKGLDIKFREHNLLITFHPVTLEKGVSGKYFGELLYALDELENTALIFTKANADAGGRAINRMIDGYVSKNPVKAAASVSLGRLRYLSVMRYCDAVVGNSSSGIIEAPSLKVGTINIGDRQKGREKPSSVIDCMPVRGSIREAFSKLYSRDFQSRLKDTVNPFGDGESSEKIKHILKRQDLKNIIKKHFYDINYTLWQR